MLLRKRVGFKGTEKDPTPTSASTGNYSAALNPKKNAAHWSTSGSKSGSTGTTSGSTGTTTGNSASSNQRKNVAHPPVTGSKSSSMGAKTGSTGTTSGNSASSNQRKNVAHPPVTGSKSSSTGTKTGSTWTNPFVPKRPSTEPKDTTPDFEVGTINDRLRELAEKEYKRRLNDLLTRAAGGELESKDTRRSAQHPNAIPPQLRTYNTAPKTQSAVPKQFQNIAGKLNDSFPVENWDDMKPEQQRQAALRSGLTPEEQWALLNAPLPLGTLVNVTDIEENYRRYGLTQQETQELTAQLWELGYAKFRAKRHDLPFSYNDRANSLFIKMMGEKEDALLEAHGFDAQSNVWDNRAGKGVYSPSATPLPTADSKSEMSPAPFSVSDPIVFPRAKEGAVAYVFYTSSVGAEFSRQAAYHKRELEKLGYTVQTICTNDVNSFMDAWNDMNEKTQAAVIISHCNGMSLIFGDNPTVNAIGATGRNTNGDPIPAISELEGPDIDWLRLLACNAAHEELLQKEGTNAADAFRDLPNVDTVYAYDGSVGFGFPIVYPATFPRLSNRQKGYWDVYDVFKVPYAGGVPSGELIYRSE